MRSTQAALLALAVLASTVATAAPALAQTALSGDTLHVSRLTSPVTVDGDLSDPAWQETTPITTWYETSPGDNTPPAVHSTGRLGFDDSAFYAAFEFDDPNPRVIRAPYADHDHIGGNNTDYGGVILDTRNDGHSAVLLLASATGVQYDAVTDDDGAGEDASPDFFWEASARITDRGWTLEMRVPFSSLRYRNLDPQTWGILLFRNYPRDFRYTIFSAPLPRGGNCFVCRANTLIGLQDLPSGGHLVTAPYVSTGRTSTAIDGPGTTLTSDGVDGNVGVDVKWTPNADNALDFTVNPDFSQVESDTAQISANERFALSFPEKRPFFLEGVELFSTPLRAVYTRAITSPRWGARATGKSAGLSYTVLATDDEGGGSAIVPGVNGSELVEQAAGSTVLVARVKRNIGRHFVSVLVSDRESHDAQGFSRLAGPDILWRPTADDTITGQWLFSDSRTPNRPALTPTWDGRPVSGGAAFVNWSHSTTHLDSYAGYKDFGEGFRAEVGFIPQVGYRAITAGGGWTVRPTAFLRRERTFVDLDRQVDRHGDLIEQTLAIGSGMDTPLAGFVQLRYLDDRVWSGGTTFPRRRFAYVARFSPSRRVAQVNVDGTIGEEVDFTDSRLGHGVTINASATLNPTDHLEIGALGNIRWLDIDTGTRQGRLFTARIARVRGTYSFNAHAFARVIAQYVSTARDPSLSLSAVDRRSGSLTGSVLLAYKINWQSVMFVGYGDDRQQDDEHALAPVGRQLFVKVSYAFQR